MLSKDAISIVIKHANEFERGLWRLTSKANRNLVNTHEWNLYEALKPSEKIRFLCRIATLIAENPEFYRHDDLLKSRLRKLSYSVFANELIAAFTLTCCWRVTNRLSDNLQKIRHQALQSLAPVVVRSLEALAGGAATVCTLDELSTLDNPALADFCVKVLGLQDYDVLNSLIPVTANGVDFHPLLKNHYAVLLPSLLARMNDVVLFEETFRRLFSADEQLADPAALHLLYIRNLQRIATCSLSSAQSVVALPIVLKLQNKSNIGHLTTNICRHITQKDCGRAINVLVESAKWLLYKEIDSALKIFVTQVSLRELSDVRQRLLAIVNNVNSDKELHCSLLDIILSEQLTRVDSASVPEHISDLMQLLKDPIVGVRDSAIRALRQIAHHLTSEHTAELVRQFLPLTMDYEDSFLLRMQLLSDLTRHMDREMINTLFSQSLVYLAQSLNERDCSDIFPVLLSLLANPGVEREKAAAEIALILMQNISMRDVDDMSLPTHFFIKHVVPLYDAHSEKFVVPFLRALFRAFDWTRDLNAESISLSLENAAKYMVLQNELKKGNKYSDPDYVSYPDYIQNLAPRLSVEQAQRLWAELEITGKMNGHFVEVILARTLVKKLSVAQRQTAKPLILEYLRVTPVKSGCEALEYLVKTEVCSIEEAGAALFAVAESHGEERRWWKERGRGFTFDAVEHICGSLVRLGSTDYLRKLMANSDAYVRAHALSGIVQILPHCNEREGGAILMELNSELQGQRENSTPELRVKTANALSHVANALSVKFAKRLFEILMPHMQDGDALVCIQIYKAMAILLSRLELGQEEAYIQQILPLLASETQGRLTAIAMVQSFPNLMARLDAPSFGNLIDTLSEPVTSPNQDDNAVAKTFEILINALVKAGADDQLSVIAVHPRARILCGAILPARPELSKNLVGILVRYSCVASRANLRASSHLCRDAVNEHEWQLYEKMLPSEKLKFLCRIAILVTENPEFYRQDEILKTNLQKFATGVFANELIAAFTLTCLLRVEAIPEYEKFQRIQEFALQTLPPVLMRALATGKGAAPCTIEELSTLQQPVLVRFCVRIMGLDPEACLDRLIQATEEGVIIAPVIQNHHRLLLPLLIKNIKDEATLCAVLNLLFRAGTENLPRVSGILDSVISHSLTPQQALLTLPIMLRTLQITAGEYRRSKAVAIFLTNLCRLLNKEDHPLALKFLFGEAWVYLLAILDKANSETDTRCLVLTSLTNFLKQADSEFALVFLPLTLSFLNDSEPDIVEMAIGILGELANHFPTEMKAKIIRQIQSLPAGSDYAIEKRIQTLSQLAVNMPKVMVRDTFIQCVEGFSRATQYQREILTALWEFAKHPRLNKKEAADVIAYCLLLKMKESEQWQWPGFIELFLTKIIPQFDSAADKFVLPFLREILYANETLDATPPEQTTECRLDMAVKFIMERCLRENFKRYIEILVPRLTASQAESILHEIAQKAVGNNEITRVMINMAIELTDVVSETLMRDITPFIIKSLYLGFGNVDRVCVLMQRLVQARVYTVTEAAAALEAYLEVNILQDNLFCAYPVCEALARFGATDYLRNLTNHSRMQVRRAAMPALMTQLSHCNEQQFLGIMADLTCELLGQREHAIPDMAAFNFVDYASALPIKFVGRFMQLLLDYMQHRDRNGEIYAAIAVTLSRIDSPLQEIYIEKMMPLLTESTNNTAAVLQMLQCFPQLVTRLDEASMRSVLDRLFEQADYDHDVCVRALESLLKAIYQAGAKAHLVIIAEHPRARILCGPLLPLALLQEVAQEAVATEVSYSKK